MGGAVILGSCFCSTSRVPRVFFPPARRCFAMPVTVGEPFQPARRGRNKRRSQPGGGCHIGCGGAVTSGSSTDLLDFHLPRRVNWGREICSPRVNWAMPLEVKKVLQRSAIEPGRGGRIWAALSDGLGSARAESFCKSASFCGFSNGVFYGFLAVADIRWFMDPFHLFSRALNTLEQYSSR